MALKRDPLGFFRRLAREAGDFAVYEVNDGPVCFVNDPALIREVLVTRQDEFRKWAFHHSFYEIFGAGLVGSDGELHRRMQRIARPAFQQSHFADYGRKIVELSQQRQAQWGEGEINLSRELTFLTLEVVTQLLFSSSLGEDAAKVVAASETLQRYSNRLGSSRDDDRIFAEANAQITAASRTLLASSASPAEGDLLSLLVQAHRNGTDVTEEQIIHEIRTFILAGHVTTANAVAAAFWLLSDAPECRESLRAEVDAQLGNRPATADDLNALPFCEMILLETLRLHSPVWILGRETREPLELGGETLAAGARLVICPGIIHRDARYFPAPDEFRPERWTNDARGKLPRYCYLPFSVGSRSCLGERFAMTEGMLLLASIAQRWEFEPASGRPDPGWAPQVIYWPAKGIRLNARRRTL